MGEYKPKRIEFYNHFKQGWQRSVSISFARERYNLTKDFYISIHLWWFGFTVVIFRLSDKE